MPRDHAEHLEKLSRVPDRLERMVEDHPSDLLCQAGAGGGWGAVEIMAFLRDWDEVVNERLDHMLAEDQPEFEDEDPDIWSIERDYHAEDPEKVVTEFRKRREQLVARLAALNDDQWQRTGMLRDGTVLTVEDLVADLVNVDQEQIMSLREILL